MTVNTFLQSLGLIAFIVWAVGFIAIRNNAWTKVIPNKYHNRSFFDEPHFYTMIFLTDAILGWSLFWLQLIAVMMTGEKCGFDKKNNK